MTRLRQGYGGLAEAFGGGRQAGDGGPADQAQFNIPMCGVIDPTGRFMVVADIGNHRVRRIDLATKTVTTIAGDGQPGYAGDGVTTCADVDECATNNGGCGALIYNDAGQVLMIRTHKWSEKWGIPGGKIDWGETSKAAMIREIKEETNLKVNKVEFVLVQDCIHSKEFYKDSHFVLLNYTCRVVGKPNVKLNHEAQEFRWLKLADAKKLKLNQPTKILIEAVEKRMKRK